MRWAWEGAWAVHRVEPRRQMDPVSQVLWDRLLTRRRQKARPWREDGRQDKIKGGGRVG